MEVLKRQKNFSGVETGLAGRKLPVLLEESEQLSPGNEIDAEIYSLVILERVVQLDHERVVGYFQDFFFVNHCLNGSCVWKVLFVLNFKGVDLLVCLQANQRNLAE